MRPYDLAHLASLSAIAMDLHIGGHKVSNYEDISRLKVVVDDFLSREKDYHPFLFGVDDEVRVFVESFLLDYTDEGVKEKLYTQTRKLSEDLENFRDYPRAKQERLRDLCVEISTKALSQIPIHPHPYRRDAA